MSVEVGARPRPVAGAARWSLADAMLAGLLAIAAACAGALPAFSVEPGAVRSVGNGRQSLYVGYPATPPPGEYRFARVHDNGMVEAREIVAVDGPGPWLTYEGAVAIPAESVREIFAAADALPAGEPRRDGREACVLARTSSAGATWQGCASPALAARVLSIVPRLAPPEVGPGCERRVCQVRVLRETPAVSHDRYGTITADAVLDARGAFWCAVPPAGSARDANTLRVVQGRIAGAAAPAVFAWLVGDAVESSVGAPTPSPAAAGEAVQVRGAAAAWTAVPSSRARAVTSRWARIASRLPAACR